MRNLTCALLLTLSWSCLAQTKSKIRVKYILQENGGTLTFYDNGKYAGCPRCDDAIPNYNLATNISTYKDYKTFLVVKTFSGTIDTMRFSNYEQTKKGSIIILHGINVE